MNETSIQHSSFFSIEGRDKADYSFILPVVFILYQLLYLWLHILHLYVINLGYFLIYLQIINFFGVAESFPVEASGLSGQQAVGVNSGLQIFEDTQYKGGATENIHPSLRLLFNHRLNV